MTNNRISLGAAFLGKPLSTFTSAKSIIHAEFVPTTGKYLLSKISYEYNSELLLHSKTKEIKCKSIVEVLQRLAKAVERKIRNGYVFDPSAMKLLTEEDETWENFTLGEESKNDSKLDGEVQAAAGVLTIVETNQRMTTTVRGRIRKGISSKLRPKPERIQMAMSSVRPR